ncbi:multidrug effflux MFS transporter [Coralloluteibacterium stylophorae]|uniref:Bcr/CflA family efflux transporter n=1 Tax=Coralloluteibacterium stylophorae TaxID=1776034 RepID=A0A8J7VUE8_9GAMM|nr:multidrug effflux MFS transporter [Coralloluteibacterium stylophorae]MBS7456368.1 multidrug effflux MFS transporter [Coralloluteibacterium stylophorae]
MTPQPAVPRGRIALLLAGLAMFGPFTIDTIFPAFGAIGRDYAAGKVAVQQTISVYLVAYAATCLLHGPLSDAFGRRRVILVGVSVFLLASIGCALATDLPMLLGFRALQGVSAGAGLVVGRAVIRDLYEGQDAQRLMSLVMLLFGVAPGIAPIIGGWIMAWAEWHAIFWFLAAFAGLLFLATALGLPETHPPQARTPLRMGLLWRNSAAMVRDGVFMRLAVAGAFNFGALFLYIASAPEIVQRFLGLNEQQYGWLFVPVIVGMMTGSFLAGRLSGRVAPTRLANVGFGFCVAGMALNLAYSVLGEPMLPWTILPLPLLSFGVALAFPILTLVLLDMYPQQRGAASSMQAFVGLVSNAVISGLLSPLLSGTPLRLALGAAAFTATAWVLWRWHVAHATRLPARTEPPDALQAADRL